MSSLAPMNPLKVTTRAARKFPSLTATGAIFRERPTAMSEELISQFETANASELQYATTYVQVSSCSLKEVELCAYGCVLAKFGTRAR